VNTTEVRNTNTSTASSAEKFVREPAFVTTHWSVVVAAGRSDTTRARHALGKLCQTYWYPLYAYVRRRGYSAHDSQDLTQEFFTQLLARESLTAANPDKGRFRSFLLTSLNHFLINEWNKRRSRKRGGNCPTFSLDWAAAEERYDLEPIDDTTPDKLFEKQWALALLNEVLNQLEAEHRLSDKIKLFTALRETLLGSRESQPYEKLATELSLTEGAIKVAVHRLRKRYRELIRAEISHTLDQTENIEEEMRRLFKALTQK
jgi:RNA polymerase sigma-70 factor (ECF subfamily)